MAQEGLEHVGVPTGDEAYNESWQEESQTRHVENEVPVVANLIATSILPLKYHLTLK